MDPAEVEFIAEREPIGIVPKFTSGKLFLLQGDFGPFKAGLATTVKI
jgi:GINS complex subunit 2